MGQLEHKHLQTIIIGGGVAGLTCALELAKEGRVVLVVEASPRLGGRFADDPRINGLVRGIEAFDGEIVTEILVKGLSTDPVTGQCLVETEWGPIQAEQTVITLKPDHALLSMLDRTENVSGLFRLRYYGRTFRQAAILGQTLGQRVLETQKVLL